MAITATELFTSRTGADGDDPRAELLFLLEADDGDDDDANHLAALADQSPATHRGLPKLNWELVDHLGSGRWTGRVDYASPDYDDLRTGESDESFSTAGETVHINVSRESVIQYRSGTSETYSARYGGLIGVNPDGTVSGCDVYAPGYRFSERHRKSSDFVTDAYKGTLFKLTGRMNEFPFRGLAKGECLFLGAEGSRTGSGDWDITFNFAGSPNVTAEDPLVIPGGTNGAITVTEKLGWDYLWITYELVEDTTLKIVKSMPYLANVERVYRFGNFAELGI